MQVNPTAKNVIGIFWMDGNGVSIGNLSFLSEMFSADVLPSLTSILAPENAE